MTGLKARQDERGERDDRGEPEAREAGDAGGAGANPVTAPLVEKPLSPDPGHRQAAQQAGGPRDGWSRWHGMNAPGPARALAVGSPASYRQHL
ncbi:hypothetical protein [Streptomyces sp. NPDC057325]|uniref:hypothetical protein n=1 Tax=unclassified Streptomyces TaxID=2593676 RepID=UPI00363F26BE